MIYRGFYMEAVSDERVPTNGFEFPIEPEVLPALEMSRTRRAALWTVRAFGNVLLGALRLLVMPFIAVFWFLVMAGVAAIGWVCAITGMAMAMPSPVAGTLLITFGFGIWLCMIGYGLVALFGGRS